MKTRIKALMCILLILLLFFTYIITCWFLPVLGIIVAIMFLIVSSLHQIFSFKWLNKWLK